MVDSCAKFNFLTQKQQSELRDLQERCRDQTEQLHKNILMGREVIIQHYEPLVKDKKTLVSTTMQTEYWAPSLEIKQFNVVQEDPTKA